MDEKAGFTIESRFDPGRSRIWLRITNNNAVDAILHSIQVTREDDSLPAGQRAPVQLLSLLTKGKPQGQWNIPGQNQLEFIVQVAPPGTSTTHYPGTHLPRFEPTDEIEVTVGTVHLYAIPKPSADGFDDHYFVSVRFPQEQARKAEEEEAASKAEQRRRDTSGDLKLPGGSVRAPVWVVIGVSIVVLGALAFWNRDVILDNLGLGFANQVPVLVSPRDGTTIDAVDPAIEFSWLPVAGATDYIVEIEVLDANNQFVRHPKAGRIVSAGTEISISPGESGEIRWRVTARKRSKSGREQVSNPSGWYQLSRSVDARQ
jgi:hypothetical protein